MAEEGRTALRGLFADVDDQGGRQQDMDMPGSSATATRKKGNRSPLRARAQQSCDNAMTGNDLDSSLLLFKSPRASPDDHMQMMMMKKEVEGFATPRAPHPPHSYTNPTFISKPTTPRDHWHSTPAGGLDRPRRQSTDQDWERTVANGKESNDGTHLIRLLADFIEGECASWVNDPKSLPVESRHSHQLAGQLRRLADAFEKENTCLSLKEKRIK